MTTRIRMIQTRRGEAGAVLAAGSEYTVADALAAELVGSGYAVDVDLALQPGRHVPVTQDPATGALVGAGGVPVDATDTGTDWLVAPAVLSYTATLTAGTSTTVLIEVRDPALTVSTAQTIVADTVSEVLRGSVLLSGASQFRIRRSSGSGTVSFLIQG